MNHQPSREEAVFHAASEIQDPKERAAYLERACGADVELRHAVEALLQQSARPFDFLEQSPLGARAPSAVGPEVSADGGTRAPAEQPGDRIGHYELLAQIGEGGCGVVYRAEQEEPIRRRVALKVIKLGMDTKDVITRFEAERQALALMDHPNIAKVLDGGATPTGRPYFVMELVHGIKITDYCDQNNLPTRARLDLFVKVCQAIQHAHQKGIIHRDIKPSNILVTLHDGGPVPKVIDFGIAKATGQQRLTDKTLFTAFRQFIGTPAYMSPEQAEMTGMDIDTRSDIYSLGVLLYELLTGQTPFGEKELLAAGLDEMRRTIREKEPLRPSMRLGTMRVAERTTAASHRQSDPAKLIHLLHGDLDWIAMKCLEKDRTRRYVTANGLAVDIQGYLNNEPVWAGPPSRLYRFQKLVLRNKGTFTAVSAVAAALIAGLATSTFLYLDEAKVRQALSREAEHARQAESSAKEMLRGSYLAQAQAGRWSQRAGRRFDGLELLKKAAAIGPGSDLRNEAIACMALTDLRVIKEWDAYPLGATFANFDRNFERYVYGDAQGTVHIRRVQDEAEVAPLEGYEPPFQALEFSPDGKLLLIAGGRQRDRVEVWNLEPRELRLRLDQPMFRAMDFSADSRLVAIASEQSSADHPIRIYSVAEHREVASFGHGSLPYSLSFHPKDPRLFLTSDGSPVVRIWECETGRLVRSFTHPGWVQGIDWHPAGDLLATACSDGRVRLWEAATGTELAQLARHQAEAVNVTFSKDGVLLASRGWDGRLELWDLASQHEVVEMEVPGFLYTFSRRDNQFGIGLQPGRLAVLEAASGSGYRLLGSDLAHGEKTLSCGFNADSRWMISTHENRVRCWDLLSGKPIAEIPRDPWEHFAVLHPDGKRLFVGTRQGVEEWSITPSSPPGLRLGRQGLCDVSPQAYIMTLSQDGRQLAVSAGDAVQILDTQSGRKTTALKPGYSPVFGALSPDGRAAVTWCVFRGLSDTDSNFCRTAFQFMPDTVPIHIGQCSGLRSDSFRPPLEWCPTRSKGCPRWPGTVSDRGRNLGPGGVGRRWNECQGSRSIQVNRERHLMARTQLTMRQIQEILRLKHQNQLSIREVARSCGLPTSTVGDYLKRAEAAGISWPLPEGQSEKELLQLLIAHPVAGTAGCPALPDWPYIHNELGRKAVTLLLLWQEYRQAQPEGYGYSRFCELYQRWAGTLDPVLRQVHLPGEKMFVDWAGQTVEIPNAQDGSVSAGHLFVAVLGASNRTYAEAFENERLAAWIAAHCHAYAFFGGVARITVPDNLKTGVIRPCRYEPLLHRSYQEMAEHYGTVIIPARIKKPRDKAKVEVGVQIAERQILAALRDQRFFNVGELNAAISPLLTKLNDQPFQKLEGSRNSWFERLEKGQLLPLPATPFELANWSKAKVNIDYHVAVEKHFYSAPHPLIHQQLDVRLTDQTVELFQHGKRVAAHRRSALPGRFTTLEEHRPKSHQRHLEWTPSRILEWVKTIGPDCAQVVERIMADRPHPEQGFRSALGIIRLGKAVGHDRLEAACRRALHFGTCSYTSLKSILQNNLEVQPLEQELPLPSPAHENLRGGPYYT